MKANINTQMEKLLGFNIERISKAARCMGEQIGMR